MIFPQERRGERAPRKLLRAAFFLGMGLSVCLAGALLFLGLYSGRGLFPPRQERAGGVFFRLLEEYDAAAALNSPSGSGGEERNRLLDALEREALGVETRLSVLKRRRTLAREDPRFRGAYIQAAHRGAELFPFSEPLAAVAAEALVLSGEGMDPEKAQAYASRLSAPELMPLAAGLHALSGALGDPARAAAVPRMAELLPVMAGLLQEKNRAPLLINAAVLRLLQGDMPAAAVLVQTLLTPGSASGASPEVRRFAAEFFYDRGDFTRSAELFSRFPDAASAARQADALLLAGRLDSARALWTTLSSPGDAAQAGIRARSLYNLAAAAPPREALPYLEGLLVIAPEDVPGIIRYTRLLDSPRAVAILESTPLSRRDPLADLELLRRRGDQTPIDRMIPETWLLIERHPDAVPLYEWGCYYFDLQRRYGETQVLIRNAALRGLDSPRLQLHRGIQLIREGRLDDAGEILGAIPPESGLWQGSANMALLLEAERSAGAALEYYETAASRIQANPAEERGGDAALVQLRIARCLRALGRERESRRVLEYALTLDPENLTARLELRRLDDRGIF